MEKIIINDIEFRIYAKDGITIKQRDKMVAISHSELNKFIEEYNHYCENKVDKGEK